MREKNPSKIRFAKNDKSNKGKRERKKMMDNKLTISSALLTPFTWLQINLTRIVINARFCRTPPPSTAFIIASAIECGVLCKNQHGSGTMWCGWRKKCSFSPFCLCVCVAANLLVNGFICRCRCPRRTRPRYVMWQ